MSAVDGERRDRVSHDFAALYFLYTSWETTPRRSPTTWSRACSPTRRTTPMSCGSPAPVRSRVSLPLASESATSLRRSSPNELGHQHVSAGVSYVSLTPWALHTGDIVSEERRFVHCQPTPVYKVPSKQSRQCTKSDHREGCRGLWAAGPGVSGRKSPHEAERHGLGVAGASPARRYGMWEGPVPRVRGCVPGQVFSGAPRHVEACRYPV